VELIINKNNYDKIFKLFVNNLENKFLKYKYRWKGKGCIRK
jgi:hypothetical protein